MAYTTPQSINQSLSIAEKILKIFRKFLHAKMQFCDWFQEKDWGEHIYVHLLSSKCLHSMHKLKKRNTLQEEHKYLIHTIRFLPQQMSWRKSYIITVFAYV
jgi:hypothetical protein